jgi:hypothetical protein
MNQTTYFSANIDIAKDRLKTILDSHGYKTLTKKQKIIADNIFNTIITSEYLICFKSNRVLSEETKIPVFTVNKTRLKLAALDMITIHEMPNGNRHNKAYYLTFKDMQVSKSFKPYSLKTKARNYMSNFISGYELHGIVKLNSLDIKDLKKETHRLKNIDKHYVKTTDLFDIKPALNVKNNSVHNFKNHALLLTCSSRYCLLAARLESAGFPVVPFSVTSSYKFSWSKGCVRRKSQDKRLSTIHSVFSSSDHPSFDSWASAVLSPKMQHVIANQAQTDFYGMLSEKAIRSYELARQCNAIGVLLPKGMVCLDVDDASLYPVLFGLLPNGYWTKTRRGYHCFIWDKTNLLQNVKLYGVDILSGDKLVVFSAIDKNGNEVYEHISGELSNIDNIPLDFKMWVGGIEESVTTNIPSHSNDHSNSILNINIGTKRFQLPKVIDEMRNDTLYRFGRSLRGQGFTESYIESALVTLNNDRSIMPNPVDATELHHIIKSAIKKKDRKDFFRIYPFNSRI